MWDGKLCCRNWRQACADDWLGNQNDNGEMISLYKFLLLLWGNVNNREWIGKWYLWVNVILPGDEWYKRRTASYVLCNIVGSTPVHRSNSNLLWQSTLGSTLVCSLTGTRDECPVMEIHLRANGDTDESGAWVLVEGRLYPRGDKGNSVRPHYRYISMLLSITECAIEKATELSSLNEDRSWMRIDTISEEIYRSWKWFSSW